MLALYGKAKKDLEDLIILDRGNEIAKQKLSEVVKNIYRVTVTQGKEVNLSGGAKVEEVSEKREHKTQAEQPKPAVRSRNGADMNKILKDYKVEEVITLAR